MKRWIPLALVLGLCLLIPIVASADVGPKPTMRIILLKDGQPVDADVFQWNLLVCQEEPSAGDSFQEPLPGLEQFDLQDQAGCIWAVPHYPIWFTSTDDGVKVGGYLPTNFRLVVYSNEEGHLWLSNPGEREGMYASFTLNLLPDGTASLEPVRGNVFQKSWELGAVIVALVLSLVLETLLAVGYALLVGARWSSFLLAALISNILSLPAVWLAAGVGYLLGGPASGLVLLAIGEVGAVFMEALIYHLITKVRFSQVLLLSLVANVVSYIVGLLVH